MKTIAPTLADCGAVTEVEQETITLFVRGNSWLARSNAPLVRRLFGTDVIPTAFTAAMPAAQVLARIAGLNPQARVVLAADAAHDISAGNLADDDSARHLGDEHEHLNHS